MNELLMEHNRTTYGRHAFTSTAPTQQPDLTAPKSPRQPEMSNGHGDRALKRGGIVRTDISRTAQADRARDRNALEASDTRPRSPDGRHEGSARRIGTSGRTYGRHLYIYIEAGRILSWKASIQYYSIGHTYDEAFTIPT